MRKLAVAVAVLVLLAVGADIAVRLWVQQEMATAISHEVPGVQHVRASISSFPFLGRLAATGSVSKVDIHLEGVTTGPVEVSEVRASVRGGTLDRGDLIDGTITITRVSRVDVAAVFTDDELTRAAGLPVEVTPDSLAVVVAGRRVSVRAQVSGRTLELLAAGVSARVPIPATDLLPCTPGVELGTGEVTLSCTSDHLPGVVVQAIGSVSLRGRGH